MSININTIKSVCELIVNKNQSGTLTPARFNTACESVNWDYFNDCIGQPALSKGGSQVNDVFWQANERITNNLRPFLKIITLQVDQTGKALRPNDFVYTSSVRYFYGSKQVECEMVNDGGLSEYVGSDLFYPTKTHPIFCVYDSKIQFYPKDLARVQFTYLSKPQVPFWGYTVVNGRPVYDPNTSVDFGFPEECLNEVVSRIVALWGISIREQQVQQYAQTQIAINS